MLISDLITDRSNPWADVYDPSRKTLRSVKEFVRENMNTLAQYADWVVPHGEEKIASLARHSGIVVNKGMHKVAVYKDEKGKLHECSAVCPHLQGVVRWNDVEKSWDCPCHGSRFDPQGKVINGPANSDLASLQPKESVKH